MSTIGFTYAIESIETEEEQEAIFRASMRDNFAMAALQCLHLNNQTGSEEDAAAFAKAAYLLADAMMKERER